MGAGYYFLCGEHRRRNTVEKFDVKILRRYEILGDPIEGACREISDIAYSVLLTDKHCSETRLGPYTVGYFAGKDLAGKAGIRLPHLERLRRPETRDDGPGVGAAAPQPAEPRQADQKTAPSTREAYTVTTLIATYWKKDDLDGLLLRIIEFHHEHPEEDIELSDLKGLNTLIHSQFTSVQNLIALLRQRHPELREFEFPAIRRRLRGLLRKGWTLNAPLAF